MVANSTSTDVIFTGPRRNRMVTNQQDCHSTATLDKQTNEEMIHQIAPEYFA